MKKGYFTDPRDGKKYKTVKIGEQVWMAENLAFKTLNAKPYLNDKFYAKHYGLLYNWEEAKLACPSGWHMSTKDEWNELSAYADKCWKRNNPQEKGTYDAAALKSKSGWNKDGNGTDELGFSALPGGSGYSGGSFDGVGYYGYWWSASEYNSNYAYYRDMRYDCEIAYWNLNVKYDLLSVRCVQDSGEAVQ